MSTDPDELLSTAAALIDFSPNGLRSAWARREIIPAGKGARALLWRRSDLLWRRWTGCGSPVWEFEPSRP